MWSVLTGPVGGNTVGQARRWGRGSTVDEAGVEGALRGRSPRTREGRRPDRPELQWSVVSGQWSGRLWMIGNGFGE